MSAQHTPGTMSLQSIISITSSHNLVVDGRVIARVAKTDGRQDYSLPGEANARRLAACWNACEGIDTHKLEGKTIAEYVASEAYVTGLATGADGVNLGLSGLACQMLASSFAGQFKGTGAINYLELRMHHAEIGHFVVNIQRQSGETPGQQLAAARAQRDELLAALEGLTGDIQALIGESDGVAGLHMNGDVAPWGELEAGGRFERLTHLPTAHAAIAKVKGGAA